jgi:hypothetical protein
VHLEHKTIELDKNSLCFTFCQIPIVYKIANQKGLEIYNTDGTSKNLDTLILDASTSKQIFSRTDDVHYIIVNIIENELK